MTAERVMSSAPTASARIRASVVLPVPGGPQSSSDVRWPRETDLRSGPASPTRCCCPTNSSNVRGRMRAASGCRSGGGLNRASGRAPGTRRDGTSGGLRRSLGGSLFFAVLDPLQTRTLVLVGAPLTVARNLAKDVVQLTPIRRLLVLRVRANRGVGKFVERVAQAVRRV